CPEYEKTTRDTSRPLLEGLSRLSRVSRLKNRQIRVAYGYRRFAFSISSAGCGSICSLFSDALYAYSAQPRTTSAMNSQSSFDFHCRATLSITIESCGTG